jgi:hypothetical protein
VTAPVVIEIATNESGVPGVAGLPEKVVVYSVLFVITRFPSSSTGALAT